MLTPSLIQEVSQLEANLCSGLADPTRIMILYVLSEGPRNVSELSSELNLPQPTTSRHLKILRERGLVQAERQGVNVQYTLGDIRLIQALDLLRGVLRDSVNRRASLMEEIP
ncbi:MAG: winged helix-turn-helix transcriptional regulator [Chloroflexi bacterium]|nr:winged helix-turn-helix transcriptional regulator [Chloroflexota bacterium]